MVNLDQVPMVEQSIKGILNYRGKPTPVIDLCQFLKKQACNNSLGSRIIIIDCLQKDNSRRILGLAAERVTEVIKCTEDHIFPSGLNSESTPFLGELYKHNNEIIQMIDVRNILPTSIAQQVFNDDDKKAELNEQGPR